MNKLDMKVLGENIRSARKKSGFTLQELSELLKCSPAAISQYERGARNPSAGMLKRLAVALNCSVLDWMPSAMWEEIQREQMITESILPSSAKDITQDMITELGKALREFDKIPPFMKHEETAVDRYTSLVKAFDSEYGEGCANFIIQCLDAYKAINEDGKKALMQILQDVQQLPRFSNTQRIKCVIDLDTLAVPISDPNTEAEETETA